MKTKKVRPVLVASKATNAKDLPIYAIGKCIKSLSDVNIGDIRLIQRMFFPFEYFQPQQLILISLEDDKVEIGDEFIVKLFKITGESDGLYLERCTKIKDVWVNDYDITTTRHIANCKKVIATQDQLSPELIKQLVAEYNNGDMKDFEIEMEEDYTSEIQKQGCDYKPDLYPKLTNGFVTVVEKLPVIDFKNATLQDLYNRGFPKNNILYTEEEVLELLDKLLAIDCSFTKEDGSKCIIIDGKPYTLEEWFDQNKKRK
jgi:hypothetical protein